MRPPHNIIEKAEENGIFDGQETERLKQAVIDIHRLKMYRFYLAPNRFFDFLRRFLYTVSPREAPRWCQYMYQDYPSG